MIHDPRSPNRRSIYLRGYDYSRPGAYYVTLCTRERLCLFGRIRNHKMILNEAGEMIERKRREV